MFVRRVFEKLQDTRGSIAKYVALATLTSVFPSVLLLSLVYLISPSIKGPKHEGSTLEVFVGMVGIVPLLETLLMAISMKVIGYLSSDQKWITITANAVFWAGLHALRVPVWGLGVLWGFFVMSLVYYSWKKVSLTHAIWVTTLVHMAINFLATFPLSFLDS